MIRDLTKSALSFSWAFSLWGAEQAMNLFRPGQRNGGNVFAPMTEAAAGQLDESMRGLYRTGDNMQRGMVDMAFSLLNPASLVNPGIWTKMASGVNSGNRTGENGGMGRGLITMMNPMNWMNPATLMRTMNNSAPSAGYSPGTTQPANPSPSVAPGLDTGTTATNESANADWGSMPSNP